MCVVNNNNKNHLGHNWGILDTDQILDGFKELWFINFICYNSVVVIALKIIYILDTYWSVYM